MYNALTGRRFSERLRQMEASQWWSSEQIRDFQWRELSKLLDVAFASVPYYREKYSALGIRREDIRSWSDYAKLPPLRRTEIAENRERLRNTAFPGKLIPHATGGSSGSPTRFYITLDSFDWRTAATSRVYAWSGYRLGECGLHLWGAPAGKTPFWKAKKVKAYQRLQRQVIVNTFQQSDALWEDVLRSIRRHRAIFLMGYVSSLEEFSRYLRRSGAPRPGIQAVIAAAEPLSSDARERIETALAAPVFNTYGSREFMSIAAECERRDGLHVNAENILVETEEPGEASPILITDLHNLGMPFLRYEIGDVAVLDDTPCECGRGLPRIRSIEGRMVDILRTVDGHAVPGIFFPHVLKEIREVRDFQVRQCATDHIVISAVLSSPVSDQSRATLEREVRKVFGESTRIELQSVESIPRLTSGKRRVTIGLG